MERDETLADVTRVIQGDLDQRSLAARAGVSATTIHDMLRGRVPTAGTLWKIIDGLGLDDEMAARVMRAAGHSSTRRPSLKGGEAEGWDEELIRAAEIGAERALERRGIYTPEAFAVQLRPHLDRIQAKYGVGEIMLNLSEDMIPLYQGGPEEVAAWIEQRVCARADCACQPSPAN